MPRHVPLVRFVLAIRFIEAKDLLNVRQACLLVLSAIGK